MDLMEILEKYEKAIYLILTILLAITIAFAVVELIFTLYVALTFETPYLLGNDELLQIFGFFLLVLIGIELLGTVKAYIRDNTIHVEIVVVLAIIAIARKVILLDMTNSNPFELVGIGIVIFALCSGYYLLRKGGISHNS